MSALVFLLQRDRYLSTARCGSSEQTASPWSPQNFYAHATPTCDCDWGWGWVRVRVPRHKPCGSRGCGLAIVAGRRLLYSPGREGLTSGDDRRPNFAVTTGRDGRQNFAAEWTGTQ